MYFDGGRKASFYCILRDLFILTKHLKKYCAVADCRGPQIIFGATLKIVLNTRGPNRRCRIKQIFGGAKKFGQMPPNLPKTFFCSFSLQTFSRKDHEQRHSYSTLPRKNACRDSSTDDFLKKDFNVMAHPEAECTSLENIRIFYFVTCHYF